MALPTRWEKHSQASLKGSQTSDEILSLQLSRENYDGCQKVLRIPSQICEERSKCTKFLNHFQLLQIYIYIFKFKSLSTILFLSTILELETFLVASNIYIYIYLVEIFTHNSFLSTILDLILNHGIKINIRLIPPAPLGPARPMQIGVLVSSRGFQNPQGHGHTKSLETAKGKCSFST